MGSQKKLVYKVTNRDPTVWASTLGLQEPCKALVKPYEETFLNPKPYDSTLPRPKAVPAVDYLRFLLHDLGICIRTLSPEP